MRRAVIRFSRSLFAPICLLVVLMVSSVVHPGAVLADTPSNGATSDLKGRANSYTNVRIDGAAGTSQNTILYCNANGATQFTSHISFALSGTPAPAGSYF